LGLLGGNLGTWDKLAYVTVTKFKMFSAAAKRRLRQCIRRKPIIGILDFIGCNQHCLLR